MNHTLEFYKMMINYLSSSSNNSKLNQGLLIYANAFPLQAWTGSKDSLNDLHECIHRVTGKCDDNYEIILEKFIITAFKDLSTQRDPAALSVFKELRRVCNIDFLAEFVWPRKIIERKDGSAVIVLHVTNLRNFEEIMNRKTVSGDFRDGMRSRTVGERS